MSIIPRNKTEIMFIDSIEKAHQFLNDKLNLDTTLNIERVCYWGRDAFHSGTYQQSTNTVCVNFRNLYGFSLKTVLTVLGHEFRHAYQSKKGWITFREGYQVKRNAKGRIESGTWKGKYIKWVKYNKLPWEIDAINFEKEYAEYVFKSGLISKQKLNTKLDGDKTFIPLIEETCKEIENKFGVNNVAFFTHYLETEEQAKIKVDKEYAKLKNELKSFGAVIENNKVNYVHVKHKVKVDKIIKKYNKLLNSLKRKENKNGFCYLTLEQINTHKDLKKPFKSWTRKANEIAWEYFEDKMQSQYVAYKTKELTIRDLTS
tara:strand:- start:2434 stop:3381 length:948 start_codon:yes stop_codon:yes gene_type:complete